MSDSEDEAPDKQLKIVIMGDGASGKVRKNKDVGQYPVSNEKRFIFMSRTQDRSIYTGVIVISPLLN